jgi:predicted ester cyclase
VIAEGDLVAYQSVWSCTHLGEWRGIPPTAKRVEWLATCYPRVRDSKLVEGWGTYDWLGVLEQLGAPVTPPNVD